jgi:hypothetical protein
MQTIGTTDMTITYSRPGVKGRQIWGALVPYDKVWRTGANEATSISFSDDVSINGQSLAKGTYSLHSIPGKDSWTLIFNKVADQWGSYSYDQAKDALRVTVTPQQAPMTEWLTFEVPQLSADKATVVLRWENLAVPFTVNTDSTKRTIAALKSAMNPGWQTFYQAANLAYEGKAATDDEINTWLGESIKRNENAQNLWLKARMQQRAGQTAEARKIADAAIAKATAAQSALVEDIKRQIATWK